MRFSLPSQLTGGDQSYWLAGQERREMDRDREWLAGRVPPLPPHHSKGLQGQQETKQESLAEAVREGLLRAGAAFGRVKPAEVGPAENDLTAKLRSSLQTFNQKWNSDWIADDDDDEVSIVTLNTDSTNTEDFDDFSDMQADLDTWLAK